MIELCIAYIMEMQCNTIVYSTCNYRNIHTITLHYIAHIAEEYYRVDLKNVCYPVVFCNFVLSYTLHCT